MKIYFAGNSAIVERESLLIRLKCDRLFSYYYLMEEFNGSEINRFKQRIESKKD